MNSRTGVLLDRVGACASALCAIHCLLTGIAMGFLAVAGLEFVGNPFVEIGFVGVAVFVGGWAVLHGVKRHHSWIPALVYVSGLASIVASHFVGHDSTSILGTIFAVLGGLLIASFHYVNQKMQHRGCECHLKRKPASDMVRNVKS